MNKTMCPGQDTRYWRPGDIFNVPCATCGNTVEFFKDDAKRRCRKCGTVIQNPRLSTGCAQWCEHAKECLGYDPVGMTAPGKNPGISVADIIIESISSEFGTGSKVLEEALKAAERVESLLANGTANPRITVPSVLLLNVDTTTAGHEAGPMDRAPIRKNDFPMAKKILESSGAENDVIDDIIQIIQAYHAGMPIDSPEYRAVAGSRTSS